MQYQGNIRSNNRIKGCLPKSGGTQYKIITITKERTENMNIDYNEIKKEVADEAQQSYERLLNDGLHTLTQEVLRKKVSCYAIFYRSQHWDCYFFCDTIVRMAFAYGHPNHSDKDNFDDMVKLLKEHNHPVSEVDLDNKIIYLGDTVNKDSSSYKQLEQYLNPQYKKWYQFWK